MPRFEVIVLGVGDTFSELHRPSALLLVCDGFHLAIDCPDMYRSALRSAGERSGRSLDVRAVDHVLVTHLHGDHVNGLEGLAFYKQFVENKLIGLVASPQVCGAIWEGRLRASMGTLWDGRQYRPMAFEDYFAFVPLPWGERTVVGPFSIHSRQTRHHVPTSALFVEAAGRTLSYSSDTAFDPDLIDFLAPADLVIHETNLGPGHTGYRDLSALPPALRDRMRLIHYPDGFDRAGSDIEPLVEGEILHP